VTIIHSMTPVRLDVWADIACPWCFIGSRNVAAALSGEAPDSVLLHHRAFMLQPQLPVHGLPAQSFFVQKYGDREACENVFARVAELGATVGIAFNFAVMPKAPHTGLAHRAVLLYDGDCRQSNVLHRLYSACFEEGRDISDVRTVAEVTSSASGDPVSHVLDRLTGREARDRLEADLLEARRLGLNAVPTVVADHTIAVQGAQPPSVVSRLLAQARELLPVSA
jgi:predicted DsbA family dithiol-disulfide isomerase